MPKRQCRIQFMVDEFAQNSRDFYDGLVYGRGANTRVAALQMIWMQRGDEYLHTAKALLEKHPELRALAVESSRLRERYLQAQ